MDSRLSELDSLQATLNESLNAIRDEITRHGFPPLSTYAQERHPLDEAINGASPKLYEARRLALASIGQLKILLQVPYNAVFEQTYHAYSTAALETFVKTGMLDTLATDFEKNKKTSSLGLSPAKLQDTLDLDKFKLTAVLRVLAFQGWVYEPTEGVYTLTRPALELCEGRSGRAWAATPSRGEFASSLYDMITHPEWKYSHRADQTAFQLCHNTPLRLFEYYKERPDDRHRWAKGVRSFSGMHQPFLIQDYPWAKLNATTIIDCGGGYGALTMSLARLLPQTKLVLQDLPETIPSTRENVKAEFPEALETKQITLEGYNFFEEQKRSGEGHVFVFRYIMHDWSDEDCIKILSKAAVAAKPHDSRIIIIEHVAGSSMISSQTLANGNQMTPANGNQKTHTTLSDLTDSTTYRPISPPPYIPANFGANAAQPIMLGLNLLATFNGCERTLPEWEEVTKGAGLEIVDVVHLRANYSVIECVARKE